MKSWIFPVVDRNKANTGNLIIWRIARLISEKGVGRGGYPFVVFGRERVWASSNASTSIGRILDKPTSTLRRLGLSTANKSISAGRNPVDIKPSKQHMGTQTKNKSGRRTDESNILGGARWLFCFRHLPARGLRIPNKDEISHLHSASESRTLCLSLSLTSPLKS